MNGTLHWRESCVEETTHVPARATEGTSRDGSLVEEYRRHMGIQTPDLYRVNAAPRGNPPRGIDSPGGAPFPASLPYCTTWAPPLSTAQLVYTYDKADNRKTPTDQRLNTTLTYTYDNIHQIQTGAHPVAGQSKNFHKVRTTPYNPTTRPGGHSQADLHSAAIRP